jgi:hypothetical protein
VEDSVGLITISTVYLPPKYSVKQEQLEDFYNNLGRQFITGGDYNAKHTDKIQTHYSQKTRITQNNGKKQLKTPMYGRTHILAI